MTPPEGVRVRPVPRVIGADVPVPVRDGGQVPYANFDYAASAPCLEAVHEAVTHALPYYSSVHRGAGYASQVTTRAYEEARETVRSFLGAWRRSAVVFTRNTTDAMNLLARAVPTGTSVVVFETEHHASLLPWKRAVRLPAPATPPTPSPPPTAPCATARSGRGCSSSPPRPTSPANCGRSRNWHASRTATAPASSSTPPSSSRTAPWT